MEPNPTVKYRRRGRWSADTSCRNKKGYEEAPDFFKLRESDGTPVICNSCNKSATDNRAIIMCSRQGCGLYWHLDCLDPPLSNPPVVRTWECPAHTEDLLAVHPSVMGPAHRVRRIKNARPIVQAFKRGMKNNGLIEVVHDDNEDSEWEDYEEFGRTYRLSAKGIKLDFISRYVSCGSNHLSVVVRSCIC